MRNFLGLLSLLSAVAGIGMLLNHQGNWLIFYPAILLLINAAALGLATLRS